MTADPPPKPPAAVSGAPATTPPGASPATPPKAPPKPPATPRGLGTGLAVVAGYVDTVGFVALFGLFTAHVTGNFVLIGKELTGPGEGVMLKLIVFPAFVAAVAAARLIASAAQRRGHSAVRRLFVLQALLLLGCMVAGLATAPITDPDAPAAIVTGVLAALAMGVQNAQGRLELASLVPTTVMTGNVTQIVIDLVDRVALPDAAARDAATQRLRRMAPAVVGFGAGAIGGAFAYHLFSYAALLLPVAVLSWAAARMGIPDVR